MADSRKHLFKNNASGTLAAEITDSQTQIALQPGDGDNFPSPGVNEIFKLTVINTQNGDREIMHVTARDGDTLTVERGQEDSDPLGFNADSLVQLRMTAGTLEYLQALLVDG